MSLETTQGSQLLSLARTLGHPVPARPGGPLLQELVPLPADQAPAGSLSAVHGPGEFPLHTDAAHHRIPPRWLLLRCADPGSGTPTTLVDAAEMQLSARASAEIAWAVWRVRNGFRSSLTSALIRPLATQAGHLGRALRYDPGCMSLAEPVFESAADLLRGSLAALEPHAIHWETGQTLIIDNWRVLHGRGMAGEDVGRRRLERVLVA